MNQKVFQGKIWSRTIGENDDALLVGYTSDPFARIWMDEFNVNQQVTVRYWITDTEKTKQELKENQILSIAGSIEADYGDAYSEITGYLWTDEKLNVGGHNLLNELSEHKGKYLYMEVDY